MLGKWFVCVWVQLLTAIPTEPILLSQFYKKTKSNRGEIFSLRAYKTLDGPDSSLIRHGHGTFQAKLFGSLRLFLESLKRQDQID